MGTLKKGVYNQLRIHAYPFISSQGALCMIQDTKQHLDLKLHGNLGQRRRVSRAERKRTTKISLRSLS